MTAIEHLDWEISAKMVVQADPRSRAPLVLDEITAETLHDDPYPTFSRMRDAASVAWVPHLRMWYVAGYPEVRQILFDPANFTTEFPDSSIHRTFGRNVLTSDGEDHIRQRQAAQQGFTPSALRRDLAPVIESTAETLVAAFGDCTEVDLRKSYAARLPILTMLHAFGLPLEAEPNMRAWYDSFERALASAHPDPAVDDRAKRSVSAFGELIGEGISRARAGAGQASLIEGLVRGPQALRDDDEVKRNLLLILFGGISTVEALILNTVWVLLTKPEVRAAARDDRSRLPAIVEETMRWRSPVQTATRHVVRDTTVAGVTLLAGETVNCMLGAANRDPARFAEPDRFDFQRDDVRHHVGFAAGPHFCLGFRLAKLQAAIAVETLLKTLPDFGPGLQPLEAPTGFEFHQPRSLWVAPATNTPVRLPSA